MGRTAIIFYSSLSQAENVTNELLQLGYLPGSVRTYAIKDRPADRQPFEQWLEFIDEPDRRLYEEAVGRGEVALLLDLSGTPAESSNMTAAVEILRRHQPVDLRQAAEDWKDVWHGEVPDPAARPHPLRVTQPGAIQREPLKRFPLTTGPECNPPEIQGAIRIHDITLTPANEAANGASTPSDNAS